MFGDLFDSNNNITFNVTLAQVLGLEGAVYCSQILDIYGKAKRKNKLTKEGFVELNREYIMNRTTISQDKQTDLDFMLSNLQIVSRDDENLNLIKINPEVVVSLIVGKSDIKTEIKIPSFNVVSNPDLKKEKIKLELSSNDKEILEALNLWLDAIFESHNTAKKLSKPSVILFQKGISKYANGNKELILELIRLATVNKDLDSQFAINRYTQGQKQEAKINYSVKIHKKQKPQHDSYTKNIATEGSLSKKIF